ncbi:MAG: hypothetical protein WC043_05615 [Pseudobdellovibrionaceae bacterium]
MFDDCIEIVCQSADAGFQGIASSVAAAISAIMAAASAIAAFTANRETKRQANREAYDGLYKADFDRNFELAGQLVKDIGQVLTTTKISDAKLQKAKKIRSDFGNIRLKQICARAESKAKKKTLAASVDGIEVGINHIVACIEDKNSQRWHAEACDKLDEIEKSLSGLRENFFTVRQSYKP